jgi:hypothetical protein
MDRWADEFCERLAAGPRLVVRYDLRDTRRSVSYEPGSPTHLLHLLGQALALAKEIRGADLLPLEQTRARVASQGPESGRPAILERTSEA